MFEVKTFVPWTSRMVVQGLGSCYGPYNTHELCHTGALTTCTTETVCVRPEVHRQKVWQGEGHRSSRIHVRRDLESRKFGFLGHEDSCPDGNLFLSGYHLCVYTGTTNKRSMNLSLSVVTLTQFLRTEHLDKTTDLLTLSFPPLKISRMIRDLGHDNYPGNT